MESNRSPDSLNQADRTRLAVLTPYVLIRRLLVACVLLATVMGIATCIGSHRISISKAIWQAGTADQDNIDRLILLKIRLPRVAVAAVVGAALAGSGVVYQVLLANPLADPYLLGISSGSGLGAVIAILLGAGWYGWGISGLAIGAFTGAVLALSVVCSVGRLIRGLGLTGLVLTGVVVNAFLAALIMVIVAMARSDQVHATLFWLIGNISEEALPVVWIAAGIVACCLVGLFFLSARLNVICFGHQQARSMGIDVRSVQFLALGLSGLMTAVAVSLAGLVGFVGLVIPHAIRLVFGGDCRQLIGLAALTGAIFLVACDTLCRVVVAPAQLPVGTVTALFGGPVFIALLLRQAKRTRLS